MSTLLGVFLSFLKNLVWIGFSIVEAAMLTIAFNYLAPKVNTIYLANINWKLPIEHVGYWHVFAFIIVIHYLGQFINTLTPKIVNIGKKDDVKLD